MMILLYDGDVYYTEATLKRAKDSGIRIYTVLIGSSSGRTALEHIAEVTQGKFYSAQDAVDIRDAIYGINRILSFRWGGLTHLKFRSRYIGACRCYHNPKEKKTSQF